MKITKPFVVIVTLICMSFVYVAMAQRVRPGPSISPRPDLTGKTYCAFGQGSSLSAEAGVSAEVTSGAIGLRLDFTSPTQVTNTEVYDSTSTINLPANTITDNDDVDPPEIGTYTVVGNRLAVTFADNGESETTVFTLTPDGRVFVGAFFGRSVDGGVAGWENGMIIGVQAASCD